MKIIVKKICDKITSQIMYMDDLYLRCGKITYQIINSPLYSNTIAEVRSLLGRIEQWQMNFTGEGGKQL